MITIKKVLIPNYLQQGELYRTLMENNDDPNEEVTFPANVLKLNSSVKSTEDCDRLLDSLRFWGICDFISKDLIAYVLHNPRGETLDILQKYESEFKFVRVLREVAEAPEKRCDVAAKGGIVEIMSIVLDQGALWSKNTAGIAAQHGCASILRLLRNSGYEFSHDDMRFAVTEGHLECVKEMHSLNHIFFDTTGDAMQELCAERGHANVLRYLFELGLPWGERTCHIAALYGKLDCLQFAYEHACPWDDKVCNIAAAQGELACLKYAHENGCPWNERACCLAAMSGELDCLQYLHEHGCPWNHSTCEVAARRGHLNCLQYAHEQGCPWDEKVTELALCNGHFACMDYALEHGCALDPTLFD